MSKIKVKGQNNKALTLPIAPIRGFPICNLLDLQSFHGNSLTNVENTGSEHVSSSIPIRETE